MTSRIQTSLTITDGDYKLAIGNGYFTFSIDPHGNRNLMIKTEDLHRVTALFDRASEDWKRAKEVEFHANGTEQRLDKGR